MTQIKGKMIGYKSFDIDLLIGLALG